MSSGVTYDALHDVLPEWLMFHRSDKMFYRSDFHAQFVEEAELPVVIIVCLGC